MTTTAPNAATATPPGPADPAAATGTTATSPVLVEVVAELTEAMPAYEYAVQYGRPVIEPRIRFLQSVEALYRIAEHGPRRGSVHVIGRRSTGVGAA